MSFSFNGADGVLVAIATFVGVVGSLFWMWVGWRAMRAHERLAAAAERIAAVGRPLPRVTDGPFRQD